MTNFENYFCSIAIIKTKINWGWVQIERQALVSIIALVFERERKTIVRIVESVSSC